MFSTGRRRMTEIAASCGVTPMTIYRHIRTGQPAST
jgi:AcrR family transcriptional regulator